MVAIVGEAAVRMRPEASGFAREADSELSGSLPGIARKAAGFFAAAFAAVKIGGFLVDAVGQATDVAESTSKVGVVFGDASQSVLDFAANASTALGQSQAQALEATGTFGNLLRAVGLNERASADMSTQMVTLASDLASFNNADPTEVLDALRSGLVGETEPLKRFGINLTAAAVQAKAVEMGLIGANDELDAQSKTAATAALIMEQTTLAQGDFARTSTGLANRQRILKAQFADVSAEIGGVLLPIVNRMAEFFLNTVIPVARDLASRFRDDVMPALAAAAAWIRDNVLPVLAELGGWLRDNVLPLLRDLGDFIVNTVIPAFVSFSGWVADNAATLGIIAAVIGTLLLPHLIRLAVQHVITKAIVVASWTAQKVAAVTSAAASLASTYRMIAGWVAMAAGAAVSFGQTIAIMALYAAESAANAVRSAAAWVVAQARTVASLVLTAAGFIAQGAVMVASMAVTAASVVAGWVVMGVQSLIQAARMAAAWIIALGPIAWVIAIVVGLVALIILNWTRIKDFTVAAFHAIVDFVVGAWRSLVSGVSNGISAVIDFVTKLPGRILAGIGNLGSLLLQKGRDLMQGLVDGISSAASYVGNVARNIVNGVIGFVNSSIIDGINDLLEFTIMGIHIDVPDIPHIPTLHEGGVFSAPSGEGLARLRDEERVITPEQRVIADNLLSDLLSGTLAAAGAAQAAAAAPVSVVNQITQQPGEDGAALAARVTQGVVWNLNAGITRPVGAGAAR